jgi:hypothetical protein
MQCTAKGCLNHPTHAVVLVVRAPEPYSGQGRFRTELRVCQDHRDQVRLDDLIDDAAWEMLEQAFREERKAIDRARTTLEFEPVS